MTEARHFLTLTEVTEHAHLSAETVIAIVDCGIIEPQGDQPQQWLFEPQMVQVIKRASRLQRDLALDWPAIAVALDLMDDLQQLRRENQRLRQILAVLADGKFGD